MLGQTDLTNPHQVEILRRSIAMTPAGSSPLNREEVLQVLGSLKYILDMQERGSRFPPPPD